MSLPDDFVTSSSQPAKQSVSQSAKQSVSQPAKEGEPMVSVLPEKERHPVAERLSVPEISENIEKVEAVAGAEISLPQPLTSATGQVVLDDTNPQQVTVTLPITRDEAARVMKLRLKVAEAVLWLAQRAKMLAKKMGGRFVYKFQG